MGASQGLRIGHQGKSQQSCAVLAEMLWSGSSWTPCKRCPGESKAEGAQQEKQRVVWMWTGRWCLWLERQGSQKIQIIFQKAGYFFKRIPEGQKHWASSWIQVHPGDAWAFWEVWSIGLKNSASYDWRMSSAIRSSNFSEYRTTQTKYGVHWHPCTPPTKE